MLTEYRPLILRRLVLQVSHLVCQASLSLGARETLFDGLDQPTGTIGRYQQGVSQATPLHILDDPYALGVSLI